MDDKSFHRSGSGSGRSFEHGVQRVIDGPTRLGSPKKPYDCVARHIMIRLNLLPSRTFEDFHDGEIWKRDGVPLARRGRVEVNYGAGIRSLRVYLEDNALLQLLSLRHCELPSALHMTVQ